MDYINLHWESDKTTGINYENTQAAADSCKRVNVTCMCRCVETISWWVVVSQHRAAGTSFKQPGLTTRPVDWSTDAQMHYGLVLRNAVGYQWEYAVKQSWYLTCMMWWCLYIEYLVELSSVTPVSYLISVRCHRFGGWMCCCCALTHFLGVVNYLICVCKCGTCADKLF